MVTTGERPPPCESCEGQIRDMVFQDHNPSPFKGDTLLERSQLEPRSSTAVLAQPELYIIDLVCCAPSICDAWSAYQLQSDIDALSEEWCSDQ